jgi:hypothetical protein
MQNEAQEAGSELGDLGEQTRQYAATRAAYLATLAGQPGFEEAAKAEAQNVMAEAAKNAVRGADMVHERVLALLRGALVALASVLA